MSKDHRSPDVRKESKSVPDMDAGVLHTLLAAVRGSSSLDVASIRAFQGEYKALYAKLIAAGISPESLPASPKDFDEICKEKIEEVQMNGMFMKLGVDSGQHDKEKTAVEVAAGLARSSLTIDNYFKKLGEDEEEFKRLAKMSRDSLPLSEADVKKAAEEYLSPVRLTEFEKIAQQAHQATRDHADARKLHIERHGEDSREVRDYDATVAPQLSSMLSRVDRLIDHGENVLEVAQNHTVKAYVIERDSGAARDRSGNNTVNAMLTQTMLLLKSAKTALSLGVTKQEISYVSEQESLAKREERQGKEGSGEMPKIEVKEKSAASIARIDVAKVVAVGEVATDSKNPTTVPRFQVRKLKGL